MKRLEKNLFLLQNFHRFNSSQRKAIQTHLNTEQIKFIIEILLNICNGNFTDPKVKEKLRRHKKKINYLLSKKPLKKKKAILVTGKFLLVVFKTLLTTLVPLALEKIIQKNAKKED